MILNICVLLICVSNTCLFIAVNMITKKLARHETYILELCNIMTEVFNKEDEDAETEL